MRTKDQTRSQKTYSYARQSPVQQEVINATRNGNKLQDASRFKKTYMSNRQLPVVQLPVVAPVFLDTITTEAGDVLLTESDDTLTLES